ncbi:MAG: GNAT family N-acetyltransferase [Oscillatoriales cyanobacterium SM2_1_8]|nr:GNAT family N-acetyltransferase [Oscillatoriales cyanobacterium SM2_1_8]
MNLAGLHIRAADQRDLYALHQLYVLAQSHASAQSSSQAPISSQTLGPDLSSPNSISSPDSSPENSPVTLALPSPAALLGARDKAREDYVGRSRHARRWHSAMALPQWWPHPLWYLARTYVAELRGTLVGAMQVSAYNRSRSTWQIERLLVVRGVDFFSVGSQLIRHALETCWEARTWVLGVDEAERDEMALYRHNGFQPLSHVSTWLVSAALTAQLVDREAHLPNCLPVDNAEAALLYQLDTAAMPPQIRQVYDLNVADFRANLWEKAIAHAQHLLAGTQEVSGYVYEAQRKAAIGYFSVWLNRTRDRLAPAPHRCSLTVHPAYTWLYPELLATVARVVAQAADLPRRDFQVTSTDYQGEREAYLEEVGAERLGRGLLMGRSVWHKVRESRLSLESLHLSRVLAGLQPARHPIPGRMDTYPDLYPDPYESPPGP